MPNRDEQDKWVMVYHLSLKSTETLAHASTWVNLEDILVNEIGQFLQRTRMVPSTHMVAYNHL